MPFDNGVWHPPTHQEMQDAVDAVHRLVDSAIPTERDDTKNYNTEIQALLGDPAGYTFEEFRSISDHLLQEHLLNGISIAYFRVFQTAWFAQNPRGLKCVSNSSPDWKAAIPLLFHAQAYESEQQTLDSARIALAGIFSACDSANRLRERCSSLKLFASAIQIDETEYQGLCDLILSETRARGGLLSHLVKSLDQFWWPEFERLVTPLHVNTSPQKTTPTFPLGYVYHLAARAVSENNFSGAPSLSDTDYFQLITDICSIQRVEPYNHFEIILPASNRLLALAATLGRFQFEFVLPQLDEREVVPTLEAAFGWIDAEIENKLGWSLKDAIRFFKAHRNDRRHRGAIPISKAVLRARIGALPEARFNALWDAFVHPPRSVNANFSRPFDAVEVNAHFKPLIALDTDTAVVGFRSVSAVAWYEAIATALRVTAGVSDTDTRVGKAFEPFVQAKLAAFGHVHHGIFKTKEAAGDIDAALETDTHIFLFELKKKTLTRAALGGDTVNVLVDLIQSVVKAQSQLAKIEYVLRKDGGIDLEGKGRLELKGRDVKRIVLSWHDYGVFHDHGFLMNFLSQMMTQKLLPIDEVRKDDVGKINLSLRDLEHWENKLDALNGAKPMRFGNAFFYALGQLLSMIRGCKTITDLSEHLTFNEFVNRTALDCYFEYGDWLRRILPGMKAAKQDK